MPEKNINEPYTRITCEEAAENLNDENIKL